VSAHPTWTDLLGFEAATRSRPIHELPAWSTRLKARVFAGRYDQELDSGAIPVPGSALAAHCARLATEHERSDLAHALRTAVSDATTPQQSARVPVRAEAIEQATAVIADVIGMLDDPRGVRVRGMARLRMVLSDGRGPLYRSGSGSLNAALRGVLAAL
jgi:hypothetical protein